MKTKKVAVFTGTRAEYGLLYWLLNDIKKSSSLKLQLIVSGMHLSPEFGETFKEIEGDGFYIDEKVEILLSSDSAVGTAKSIGLGVLGFADALSRLKPDAIVVLGDRFEALAIAQTAMILRLPIVHLHGGEVTEGAYDDAIRHAITKLSYLHATSTEGHRQRVIQLGEAPDRVFNVGAIGLDHLKRGSFMTIDALSASLAFKLKQPFVVVTYHPVTLGDEDPVATVKAIFESLQKFDQFQVIVTYPNADDGGRKIIPIIEDYARQFPVRILAIKSLGHERYLSAIKLATAVIGNSSSGIIEAPSFDIPTVNIGVRQKGRMAAKSVINAEPNRPSIAAAISIAINRSYKEPGECVINPYGQGNAGDQIINMLKTLPLGGVKVFNDLKVEQ